MPAGRPPLFKSVEELEKAIVNYFEYIKGETEEQEIETKNKKGESKKEKITVTKRWPEHPTITGLALYLGFSDRRSFYDYEDDGEFSHTIKKARLKIESIYEQALHSSSPTGAIFALKNFGWKDKQEIEQKTQHSGEIKHIIDYSKLSDDTLRELAKLDQPEQSKD